MLDGLSSPYTNDALITLQVAQTLLGHMTEKPKHMGYLPPQSPQRLKRGGHYCPWQ